MNIKLKRALLWIALAIPVLLIATFGIAYARSGNDCDARRNTTPRSPMKAVVYCEYGTAAVLQHENLEKPVVTGHEVLVRVRAAALNPLDWHFIRGTPRIMRLGTGLRKPKVTRLGVDFAGVVEAVGDSVTQFKPGDEVFGGRTGAFAEYVVVRDAGAIVLKPANVTFEEAAGVGIAAVTALQGLRDKGKVQPGHKVLINGASGGVGTFAVQIAKVLGAHVTGVSSGRNHELVRSLGADVMIDYTKEDYTASAERYDLILDNVANQPLSRNRRLLKPDGKYVLIGGGGPNDGKWIGPMIRPVKLMLLSPFVKQDMGMMLARLNQEDLMTLADLMKQGKVRTVVDRKYNAREITDAIAYLETGRARGKVVVVWE